MNHAKTKRLRDTRFDNAIGVKGKLVGRSPQHTRSCSEYRDKKECNLRERIVFGVFDCVFTTLATRRM